MKRKITLISLNLLFFLLLVCPSTINLSADTMGALTNPLKDTTLSGLIETILSAVVQLGIVVVTGAIIFAGFKYVTASGNTTKLKQAHEAMYYILIGSAIVLGAYAVRQIVMDTVSSVLK